MKEPSLKEILKEFEPTWFNLFGYVVAVLFALFLVLAPLYLVYYIPAYIVEANTSWDMPFINVTKETND